MQEIAKTINGRFSGYAGSQLTCRMMDYEIIMDSALNDYYPVINATTMTNFQNFNCDPYLTGKSASLAVLGAARDADLPVNMKIKRQIGYI